MYGLNSVIAMSKEELKNGDSETKAPRYSVLIGEELKTILDKQIENIKKATYNVVKGSYYEAGEIIAKKLIQNNLV